MRNLGSIGYSWYSVTTEGQVYSLRAERFMSVQDKGYQMVGLRDDSGSVKNLYVHRLVAAVYCEGYDESLQVNHIDGNKGNNFYKNLEWVTRSQNMIHASRTGLLNSKTTTQLSTEIVHKVCRYLENGSRPCDVAEMLGVTPFNVQDILELKSFKDIGEQYNFSKVKRKFRLSEDSVLKCCALILEGKSNTDISKVANVKAVTVRRIRRRETFKHLTDQFDW